MADVEDLEVRHLTVWNAAGVALVALIVGWSLYTVAMDAIAAPSLTSINLFPLAFAAVALVFGASGLYGSAVPEHEGYCETCGEPMSASDRTDETDVYLQRAVRHPPRRVSVFGHSFVTRTRSYDVFYCSDECAREDPLDHAGTVRADPVDDPTRPVDDVGDAEVSD